MPIIDREVSQSGLITEIGFEDEKLHIRYSQDASPLHEQNRRMREDPEYARYGIKKGWMHGVSLSTADCLKMMVEDGVNPYVVSAKELNQHVFKNRDKWGHAIVTSARIGRQGR